MTETQARKKEEELQSEARILNLITNYEKAFGLYFLDKFSEAHSLWKEVEEGMKSELGKNHPHAVWVGEAVLLAKSTIKRHELVSSLEELKSIKSLKGRIASHLTPSHQHIDVIGSFSSEAHFYVIEVLDCLILKKNPVSSHHLSRQSHHLSSQQRAVRFYHARLSHGQVSSLTQVDCSLRQEYRGLNMSETAHYFLLDELTLENGLPHRCP